MCKRVPLKVDSAELSAVDSVPPFLNDSDSQVSPSNNVPPGYGVN